MRTLFSRIIGFGGVMSLLTPDVPFGQPAFALSADQIATVLDLRAALMGRRPCPCSEIWVSDADLIIVPKNHMLRTDNIIELLFTKGIYGIVPFSGSVSFTNLTTLTH